MRRYVLRRLALAIPTLVLVSVIVFGMMRLMPGDVVMRMVDLFWLIRPVFSPGHFVLHWLDFAAPIGVGGVWLAFFFWQLGERPLLPRNDPELAEAVIDARH